MRTTVFATFKVVDIIFLAICITLLVLAVMHETQTLLASIGWLKMVSVSWNG